MPSLVAFGRAWHVASDDLPLPCALLVVVHCGWCGAVAAALGTARQDLAACAQGTRLSVYMLGVVFVFACAASVEAAACAASLRGTPLTPSARAAVPRLLALHAAVTAADVAFSLLGVSLAARSGLLRDEEPCLAPTGRAAVLAVVLGNWAVLLLTFLVVQCSANVLAGLSAQESWRRRLALLGRLLRLCGVAGLGPPGEEGGDGAGAMAEAARVVARVAGCADLTPSDCAVALVLVGVLHADEARRGEAAAGGRRGYEPPPLLAPLDGGEGEDAGGGAAGGGGGGPAPPPARPLAARSPPLPDGRADEEGLLDALSLAAHFSAFALAPYGWPLYLYAHPGCGACELCCGCGVRPHRGRGGRSPGDDDGGGGGDAPQPPAPPQPPPARSRPGCLRLSRPFSGGPFPLRGAADGAALLRFCGAGPGDVVHFSPRGGGVRGCPPYALLRCRATRSLVLCVRGTLSVADCVTDVLCEPAALEEPGGGGCGGGAGAVPLGLPPGSCAHSGALACARALLADLRAHGAMERALRDDDGGGGGGRGGRQQPYALVLTGHSLGAGVAALLGLLLRPAHPGLRVWAFAPPGGLLSEPLAGDCAAFCTAVVLGNDMISRMSVQTLERLRDEMVRAAARARLPKLALLRRAAAGGPGGRALRPSDLMHPPSYAAPAAARGGGGGGGGDAAEREAAAFVARYEAGVAAARAAAAERGGGGGGGGAPLLFPPGRLLHLVKRGRVQGRGSVYAPRWGAREGLVARIVVSRNMFVNHFPDKVTRELRRCAEALGAPPAGEVAARQRAAEQQQQQQQRGDGG